MRLFSIIALIMLVSAAGALAECTDTDGGQDFATKGTAIWLGDEYPDICQSEDKLIEYFCEEDTGKVNSVYQDCKCADGACTDAEKKPAVVEEVPEEPAIPPAEEPSVVPEEKPVTMPEKEPATTSAKSYSWIIIVGILVVIAAAAFMFLKKGKVEEVKK